MPRPFIRRLVAGLAFAWLATGPASSTADGPRSPTPSPAPAARETPGLRATQVTVAIEKGRKRRQFRATVMARKDDVLTILTAAHCISGADEHGPALLLIDGEVVEGSVLSVAQNPLYRNGQDLEIAGPDNAIARFRVRPGNRPASEALDALRPAPAIAGKSYPSPSGQTISVRMVDGHGVEHALKAGNHSHPRWLEWGPAYKPIPGDSGGGVFVMHAGPDGKPKPVLIGTIVGRDDRGGGASLVSRDMPWIADELSK